LQDLERLPPATTASMSLASPHRMNDEVSASIARPDAGLELSVFGSGGGRLATLGRGTARACRAGYCEGRIWRSWRDSLRRAGGSRLSPCGNPSRSPSRPSSSEHWQPGADAGRKGVPRRCPRHPSVDAGTALSLSRPSPRPRCTSRRRDKLIAGRITPAAAARSAARVSWR